eukprot:g2032.t1
MSFFDGFTMNSKNNSEREKNAQHQSFLRNEFTPTTDYIWSRQRSQNQPVMTTYQQNTYPYIHQTNGTTGYHQVSPQYFSSQSGTHGLSNPSSHNEAYELGKKPGPYYQLPYYPPGAGGYHPGYGYYPYPGHAVPTYPPGAGAEDPEDSEDLDSVSRTGMMSVEGEGRRPLFLVALFVVSIAVLLVSFPLTLLSAGYIGPLGLMFATGPFATVFAFWAIYLTPCECYPNIDWAISRIRVFATTAAVFDAVGTIGVPISMYGAQCPDDDDTMLGCEDELPAAKGVSLAVAVVLGTHCFLCLLVRSNARKLAESKFGDTRTEGIVLTPTPFKQ